MSFGCALPQWLRWPLRYALRVGRARVAGVTR